MKLILIDFTVPPLLLLCGSRVDFTDPASAYMSVGCSALNAQGSITYVCDVDGDSIPCEWIVNLVLMK